MPAADRFPLPPGLPSRLCAGKDGFNNLCELLAIVSSKQKHAIVNASSVKRILKANGGIPPRQSKTAERLRLSLLGLYRDPEARRDIWRHHRQHGAEGKNDEHKLIPSLEHAALTRYDATVLTGDPHPGELADCAPFHPPDSAQDDWRIPALAALPRLRHDFANWSSLPLDRHPLVIEAAFATATVLDDTRLLRWAVRQGDDIAEQYAFVVAEPPQDSDQETDTTTSEPSEHDVFASLRDATQRLRAAAVDLAEQPPTGDLFDAVAKLSAEVNALREPVLERTAIDTVGNLIDDFATYLDEKSSAAPWLRDQADEIVTVWHTAYPPEGSTQLERLRADVRRAMKEGDERLARVADAQARAADAAATLERHKAATANKGFSTVADMEMEVAHHAEVQSAQTTALTAVRRVLDAWAPFPATEPPPRDQAVTYGTSAVAQPDPVAEAREPGSDESGEVAESTPSTEETGSPGKPPPEAHAPTVTDPDTDRVHPISEATARPPAEPDLPLPDGATQTGVADPLADAEPREDDGTVESHSPRVAIWNALGNGRLGLAYQIARLDSSGGPDVPSAELLAAVALGTVLRGPDDDLAHEYGRRISALAAPDLAGTDQHSRDALNLLVFCASLRPALFASQQVGAIPLLRRIELSSDLAPVYRFARAVADQAEKLQRGHLDLPTLVAMLDEAVWHDRLAAHAEDVTRWRSSAASATFLCAPASAVWRQWLADGGILAELVGLVSTDRSANEPRVGNVRDRLASRKAVADMVEKTRRNLGGRGRRITGPALSQLENRLARPLELAGEWLRIIAAKPDDAGRTGAAVERLRRDVDKLAPAARSAIERLQNANPALPLASALIRALDAIGSLQGILRRDPDIDLAIGPVQVLSDDLLLVPEIRLDANGHVDESTSREAALALVLDDKAHVGTLSAAFDARLDRRDLHGAFAVCARMAAEADSAEDVCRDRLDRAVAEKRQLLRRRLGQFNQMLEQAFTIGEITDDQRADLNAEIADLSRCLADPDRALDAIRDYDAIEREVEAPYRAGIARLKTQLDPYLPLDDPREQHLVQDALKAGDLVTLHEQLDCIRDGQPLLSTDTDGQSHLGNFLEVVNRMAEELNGEAGPSQDSLVGAASRREDILGLNFSALSPAQSKHSATLLERWYLMSRSQTVEPELLAGFFAALGFSLARNDVRVRSGSAASIRTEPLRTRELCPVHPFGSDADGRYEVILNRTPSARESIIQSIDPNPNAHVFVLHFGKLTVDDLEWLRRWSIRYSAQFVAVDETLVLYLATLPGGVLRALFECALPFTCVEPFFTAPGLVPPESFFGRESERRTIMDRYGSCFVYGGRQLGKTALLHAAQFAFHDPASRRLAEYVDLKVHDIGIAHGADHIWQVLWPVFVEMGVVPSERSMPRGRDSLVDAITQSVADWLAKDDDNRILLLLDEADAFLADDLKNDFPVSTRLKGLMDATQRKFKVVLCGLHNVLRNTERANHPLAHLGEPVCVGALLGNGDLQQARALVRSPMAAVGYTFETENLLTQILVWTNYYPSLLQLYGEALLRYVRQSSPGDFPHVITADDIQAVFDRDQLRDRIRERFSWTLQLDPRYEVIAYAMADEILGHGAYIFSHGLAGRAILDLAKDAWSDGFDITEREFGTLLQEMCGLGVLRQRSGDAGQTPSYVFRNPNVILMLGDTANIIDVLLKDRGLPDVFEASASHGHYPDSPQSARRGPLTYEQESLLKRGRRIAVLCGTRAANLPAVGEFLGQRMEKGRFRQLEPCMDDNELARRLNALRPGRDTHVYLLGEDDPWTLRWIERASVVIRTAQRGTAIRVVLPADPDQLWRLVAELPDEYLGDSSGLFDWVAIQPWNAAFLRRWASDQNLHEALPKIDELLELSGGWPSLLERFAESGEKTWQAKSGALNDYIAANSHELLDALGLADNSARQQMVALRDCGTLTPDDVEVYATLLTEDGSHALQPGVLRRRLCWASQLGLVQDVGGSLSLNTLVARILPDVDA